MARRRHAQRRDHARALALLLCGAAPLARQHVRRDVGKPDAAIAHLQSAALLAERLHQSDICRAVVTAAFDLAGRLFASGRLWQACLLLDLLDLEDQRQFSLLTNLLRRTGQFERLAELLDEEMHNRPFDPFLASARFTLAREMLDWECLARHRTLMASPDSGFAAALLGREPAASRVLWAEDEAMAHRPVQETRWPKEARPPPRYAIRPADQPLRIGYLHDQFDDARSADTIMAVLAQHDRSRFEICLFDDGRLPQRPEPQLSGHRRISIASLDDAAAASEIHRHGIDILVDLKGPTLGGRRCLVDHLKVPLKLAWPVFPGPLPRMPEGLGCDYRITDAVLLSEEGRRLASHHHCVLPECALPQGKRMPVELADRATTVTAGDPLPEEALVIAGFAPAYHLNSATLALWASVITAIPEALLWLQRPHALPGRNIIQALAGHGICPSRILHADPMPHEAHLTRLGLADLALDTLPANTPQAADFLFAGVPVLTLSGQTAAGRQTASLLQALGLPDLIFARSSQVVEAAATLVHDPFRLLALRQRIERARVRSPAFDAERLCRHLEDAYRMMAERLRAGLAPTDIQVPPRPASSQSRQLQS
ncbi:hypothetical protein FE840_009430 [Peteryoungia desertarenae]|uniref:O-GlcNAc transferase C-terminal domain-containing protein n=1 Tax=Peteryoungia desertarenae TaxID=1813451 RepID=A0ABX6QMA5_9HYPH|nr:hypothetical protein [Peteryoungia desertarenae]QLF69743.1 hypothetical protein FE840_009430 [Peteryoungia desertarenae]